MIVKDWYSVWHPGLGIAAWKKGHSEVVTGDAQFDTEDRCGCSGLG